MLTSAVLGCSRCGATEKKEPRKSQIGGSGSKLDLRLGVEGCALLGSSHTRENSNSLRHFECGSPGWFIPPCATSPWEEGLFQGLMALRDPPVSRNTWFSSPGDRTGPPSVPSHGHPWPPASLTLTSFVCKTGKQCPNIVTA